MPGFKQCGKDTYCNDDETCCKEKGTPMCCPYPDVSESILTASGLILET